VYSCRLVVSFPDRNASCRPESHWDIAPTTLNTFALTNAIEVLGKSKSFPKFIQLSKRLR
jgi:hypothetical protein